MPGYIDNVAEAYTCHLAHQLLTQLPVIFLRKINCNEIKLIQFINEWFDFHRFIYFVWLFHIDSL